MVTTSASPKDLENLPFQKLVDASYDGYWDWHIQEDYEYMSPTFWNILGFDPKEKKHHPSEWQQHIFPEDLKIAKKNFDEHVRTKGEYPYKQEVRYIHKNGSVVTVICSGLVVEWGENNEPLRMIGTHTDVTQLRRRGEELKRKNEELKQFSYFASHDLKAPLRHISSYIDLMKNSLKNKLSEEEKRFMKIIQDSTREMNQLIKSLLDLCYVGSENFVFEKVDIIALLDLTFKRFKEEVKVKYLFEKSPEIHADPVMLKQLLVNVISNSIKYQKKEVPLSFEVSAEARRGRWIFKLSDNGRGIESDDLEKVFRPFFRARGSSDHLGAGIGLAICRKIVEAHGGSIWLESEVGEGTSVLFSLPLQKELKK